MRLKIADVYLLCALPHCLITSELNSPPQCVLGGPDPHKMTCVMSLLRRGTLPGVPTKASLPVSMEVLGGKKSFRVGQVAVLASAQSSVHRSSLPAGPIESLFDLQDERGRERAREREQERVRERINMNMNERIVHSSQLLSSWPIIGGTSK